ncbi:MAG: SH3 domain-containing protein [Clostridiales bacterium]|nr:SH3 domain-containing protein [Clostridiales bacterium]
MKKALLIACLMMFSLFAILPGLPAQASVGTPHIVVSGEVWLLDENGNRLFLLPDTYYARINNLDDAYYYITFNGVSGKVSKNVVTTTGYHTTAKGTLAELRVSEAFIEFVSINLKASPGITAENVVALPVTESFTFLGEYPTSEGVWYYVKYNQHYGYIRSDRTNIPDMNIEAFVPEPAPSEPTQETPEPEKPIKELINGLEGNTLRIIVIVALAIPALIIIFILFRPSKGRKEKYYEN